MPDPAGFLILYPEAGSTFSERLWRKGAKRLVRRHWGDEVALRERAIPAAARAEAVAQALAAGQSVLLADSLFAQPSRTSFLTPTPAAALESLEPVSVPDGVDRAVVPSLAYWAFPKAPGAPEALAAVKGKPWRTSLVLSSRVTPPAGRNARQQAYLEFQKWDLGEVLDELVIRHVVFLSHGEPAGRDDWDLYDLALRSRKPELVRMAPQASVDEQYATALSCHQVVTDYPELAAAALKLGRRVVLLGQERDHPCVAAFESPNLLVVPPYAAHPGELRRFLAVTKAVPHERTIDVEPMAAAARAGRRVLLQA